MPTNSATNTITHNVSLMGVVEQNVMLKSELDVMRAEIDDLKKNIDDLRKLCEEATNHNIE